MHEVLKYAIYVPYESGLCPHTVNYRKTNSYFPLFQQVS